MRNATNLRPHKQWCSISTVVNSHYQGKPRRSSFAKLLMSEWRRLELPLSAVTIVVAVSGGADSSALLLGLDELVKQEKLDVRLLIAHLDHGLRTESRNDAKWVKALGKAVGHKVIYSRMELNVSRTKPNSNLEQAARDARYDFLLRTARRKQANFVLTGHTLDDQAETILLRLMRGSSAEGLAGMSPVRELAIGSDIKLARPLLTWARREQTEAYCDLLGIDFRKDEMNEDEAFTRVRVRQQLLPLMKTFNKRIVATLSRTASLLNEDATALAAEAGRLLELASKTRSANETAVASLDVSILADVPLAIRRRVLREWILRERGDLSRLERVHLLAVEKLLEGNKGGRIAELPGGMVVTRKRGILELSGRKRLKS